MIIAREENKKKIYILRKYRVKEKKKERNSAFV